MNRLTFLHVGSWFGKTKELSRIRHAGYKILLVDDINFPSDSKDEYDFYLKVKDLPFTEVVHLIFDEIKRQDLDMKGVFTLAEGSVVLCNKIAHYFGYPPISKNPDLDFRDKYEVRNRLDKFVDGLPICEKITPDSSIPKYELHDFPLIVKPIASMESRLVQLVSNQKQLESALENVFSKKTRYDVGGKIINVEDVYAIPPIALIESYILGKGYSAEVVVVDSVVKWQSVTLASHNSPPYFYDVAQTVGMQGLLNDAQVSGLNKLVLGIVESNEIKNCILHVEFKVQSDDSIKLIECNFRLAGDGIATLIFETYGVDILLDYLNCLSGKDSNFIPRAGFKRSIKTRYYISSEEVGVFRKKLDFINKSKIEWFYENGSEVHIRETSKNVRLGVVEFSYENQSDAIEDLNRLSIFINSSYVVNPKLSIDGNEKVAQRMKRRSILYSTLITSMFCFVGVFALGFFHWKQVGDYVEFLGKNLSSSIAEYVVGGEVMPVAEYVEKFNAQKWTEEIVVVDSESRVIYGRAADSIASKRFSDLIDPSLYEYRFPISVGGVVFGQVLINRGYSNVWIPLVIGGLTIFLLGSIVQLLGYMLWTTRLHRDLEFALGRMNNVLVLLNQDLAKSDRIIEESRLSTLIGKYRVLFDELAKSFGAQSSVLENLQVLLNQIIRIEKQLSERWELARLAKNTSVKLDNLLEEARMQALERELTAEVYSQVAHDIRSPMAALKIASTSINDLETKKLIESCLIRITEIVGDLNKAPNGINFLGQGLSPHTIVGVYEYVKEIVSSKEREISNSPNVKLSLTNLDTPHNSSVILEPKELKRILSNLLNNAIEAIDGVGEVKVYLRTGKNRLLLSIADSGRGIDSKVISLIFRKGFSLGKDNGSGLGLHHARTTIEKWNGKIDITSQVNVGTVVTIELPLLGGV